jgi:hypothetical protein
MADCLIRLLDMCHRFSIRPDWDTLTDVPALRLAAPVSLDSHHDTTGDKATFGWMVSWLHWHATTMWETPSLTSLMLRSLVTIAGRLGIDLEAEFHRKLAYNRTRPYQHGGRTLTGDRREGAAEGAH